LDWKTGIFLDSGVYLAVCKILVQFWHNNYLRFRRASLPGSNYVGEIGGIQNPYKINKRSMLILNLAIDAERVKKFAIWYFCPLSPFSLYY
jgi:hypothetical protein